MATKSNSNKNAKKTNASGAKGNEKAEAAKILAAKLRQEQEKKAKQTRIIFGGVIGAVAVALIAVIVAIIVLNPNSEANIANKISDVVESGAGPKAVVAKDGSITVSKNGTGENKAVAGIPTVDIYNDFICPACALFENQFSDTIKELINNGTANFRFHPMAWFDNTSPAPDADGKISTSSKTYAYSTRAAAAVFYAVEHTPDKYLDIIATMYNPANQPKEGEKYDKQTGTNEAIQTKLTQAGVTPEVAKAATQGTAEQPATNFDDIDWANEFPNVPARNYVPGTTGGPYIKFAQSVSQLVSRQGFVKGTPYIAIEGTEWNMKALGKDATPERFKSDVLKAAQSKK
jgi:protein-disulfide isomerase